MGYYRAGFEVVGVDIKPQPRYPFKFVQADALTYPLDGFDAVHASPPCQGYSVMRYAPGAVGAPMLIDVVRDRLLSSGLPYVIENVEAARSAMLNPIVLCGSMFQGAAGRGLEAHHLGETLGYLRRHRLFECSFPVTQLACQHHRQKDQGVIGVYGGHARLRAKAHGGRGTKDSWPLGHLHAASTAMEIDWMTLGELSEAIPPDYTHFLGAQIMYYLDRITP